MESLKPVIQVVDTHPVLKYRCAVCKTRNQPFGKVNKVVAKTLYSAQWYMKQHCGSATHLDRLAALENAGEPRDDSDGGQGHSPVIEDCKGLRIDLGDGNIPSLSSLHQYPRELRLWLSYAKFSKVNVNGSAPGYHNYSLDVTRNCVTMVSRKCRKKYEAKDDGHDCCVQCWNLSGPTRVVRKVVRFCAKYFAAQLLQKRFFATESELKLFVQGIDEETTYGERNRDQWEKIQSCSNRGLQVLVRRAWKSQGEVSTTSAIQTFVSTTVDPCLKVHASSVNSNVSALASAFVDALSSNSQSESWPTNVKKCQEDVTNCYNMLQVDTG